MAASPRKFARHTLLKRKWEVYVLRDPTRGGLATSLVEISKQSKITIELDEQTLPVRSAVRTACEMLGFDPLSIANEGKRVAFVKENDADRMRLKTAIEGPRLVDMLPGEILPRICKVDK